MRKTELELTVERELPRDPAEPPKVARLAARYAISPEGAEPMDAELAEAYAGLLGQLDRVVARLPSSHPRRERELTELIETYRPRQSELIQLLREDGELTTLEYELLREYLSSTPGTERRAAPSPTGSPIAALPLANDRTPTTPRSVPDLLSQYQISSLKQAGAVRARRQISYDEYMALKRHFTAPEAHDAPAASP